jgi:hypothetical protein
LQNGFLQRALLIFVICGSGSADPASAHADSGSADSASVPYGSDSRS